MKKLQRLTLQVKAKELSVHEQKNIKGGGYFGWCACGGTAWKTGNALYDCMSSGCTAGCRCGH